MKTKNFVHDLNKLIADGWNVVMQSDLFDQYFYQGHPNIHISSFDIDDAFIVLADYISIRHEVEIDANGGFFQDRFLKQNQDGKINVAYTFEDIVFDDNNPIDTFDINVEGYVLKKDRDVYLLVTSISYNDKLI